MSEGVRLLDYSEIDQEYWETSKILAGQMLFPLMCSAECTRIVMFAPWRYHSSWFYFSLGNLETLRPSSVKACEELMSDLCDEKDLKMLQLTKIHGVWLGSTWLALPYQIQRDNVALDTVEQGGASVWIIT